VTQRLDTLTKQIQNESVKSMLRSKPIQEVYIDAALETLAEYIVKLESKQTKSKESF
jgi:hypothetical protein